MSRIFDNIDQDLLAAFLLVFAKHVVN